MNVNAFMVAGGCAALLGSGYYYGLSPIQMPSMLMPKLNLVAEAAATTEDPYARSRAQLPLNRPEEAALLTGNSNKPLAEGIAKALGINLLEGEVKNFADGEIKVKFNAKDVIGKDCYII